MGELKTKQSTTSVDVALKAISDEQQKKDCQELVKIFSEATKEKPVVWSNGVIGFGAFSYKSDRSTQQGEWFLTGFSPRKQNITIYVIPGAQNYHGLLKKLGKYKFSGKSCILIKNLSDVNVTILKKIITAAVKDMKTKYGSKK